TTEFTRARPPLQPLKLGDGSKPLAVVAADVNADGLADLVVADNGGNNVSVLLGNGDGTFQPPRTFAAGTGPDAVAVADVNGDGRPDLVVTDFGTTNVAGTTVSVLLGNGDGTFQAATTVAVGSKPNAVAVADV